MNATPEAKRVSVVVVSHNRRQSLVELLKALGSNHQIVVVDNGSSDGSQTESDIEYPSTQFIRLPKNFGLTKALNIGIRAADGTYILLLHDDTCITGTAVDRLADFLESHPEAGSVSPLLTNQSGAPVPQVRALPSPALPDPPYAPASSDSAESVLGAATMYRTYFLRAIRQIDERYGTYGADAELSWQVKKAGKKSVILRDVQATHLALPSAVKKSQLAGDRAAGTAAYLGSHVGMMPSLLYRLTKGLAAVFSLRMSVAAGLFSGQKIDGAQ